MFDSRGDQPSSSELLSTRTGSDLELQIIHYPHPTLRHVSKPLKRVDAEVRAYASQMFDLMYQHEGVGLAANQVNLPYRLFVINATGDPEQKDAQGVFINPVLSRGKTQVAGDEGCLSIPGISASVSRHETVTLQAYNLAGEEVTVELSGFVARVVQHEVDHLDGRLFIDRLSTTQMAEVRDALEEFEIEFSSMRDRGEMPTDDQVAARLAELEQLRT